MAAISFSDALEPMEVEMTLEPDEAVAVTPSLALDLRALNAPDSLVRDAAAAAAAPNGAEAAATLDGVDLYADFLRGDDGEIISVETVYRRPRVLGCSAPNASGAKVTTTLAASGTGEGGFSLKLGGFGLESSVKYTVTEDLELECASGETRIGYILVPLTQETRLVTPPGAAEKFPVKRLIPITDRKRFSRLATKGEVGELLEGAYGPDVPLGGGDAPFSGSSSEKVELAFSVELGYEGEVNGIGLSASLSGSVELTTDFSMPAGSFSLRWLSRPPGAVVMDAPTR